VPGDLGRARNPRQGGVSGEPILDFRDGIGMVSSILLVGEMDGPNYSFVLGDEEQRGWTAWSQILSVWLRPYIEHPAHASFTEL
jgi:hypothetical protein